MRNQGFILLLFICMCSALFAQKYTISGYIREDATGEDLVGTNVLIRELSKGTISNNYGFFSLTIPEGEYTLEVSFLGFKDYVKKIKLNGDLRLNIRLESSAIVAEEVTIEAERSDKNIKEQIGMVKMPVQTIKELPAFLGEADVLKTIQLLPGVQSATEGASGFYVRGGGPDQNLVILDEAIVYNASHLFGFFSVFNADAVKDINLIKGGMPAQYGGRLSSVLDITMKEGNNREYEANGSLGLISSHATLQGPIVKEKSSFIVTARRTYADAIARPFLPKFEKTKDFAGTGYYFYDINAKANYRFSDKDRIFLSGYYGKDVFLYGDAEAGFNASIPWGNATASARWNHLFNHKLFFNATAVFSNYNFEMGMEQDDFEFRLFSAITDYTGKFDFTYLPSIRHNLKFGASYIHHVFEPSSVSGKLGETEYNSKGVMQQFAHEGGVYINDEFDLSENIKISAGIRGSAFQQVGPFERYVKDGFGKTTDTVFYGKGDNVALYKHIEPRISTNFILNSKTSVKASFTQNYQYIHLATLSSGSMPTDLWVPSSEIVAPQKGMQIAAGFFRNLKNDTYETSIEVYYKTLENQLEYKDGYTPADNVGDNSDNYFAFGKGKSYGIEFFIKKRLGDLTGWIGYTLAKTDRIFEEVNNGRPFPAKYDRRHDLSYTMTYKYNDKWTFSTVFVYATGSAITLPVARYIIDGRIVNEYGDRNSYRMPAYHRLDLSATYYNKQKQKEEGRRFATSWNFSVYNVYNRKNPYFIYFDNEGDIQSGNLNTVAKQVSLFPILPSITLNIDF